MRQFVLFGSVAEKVVRLAECPVLTVAAGSPAKAKEEPSRGKGEEVETPAARSGGRGAYQGKIERQLKEWGAKIDELGDKLGRSKGQVKAKYERQVEELRDRQETVQKKLQEMNGSGKEAWKGLRSGIEEGLDELRTSFDQTMSKLREKGEAGADAIQRRKKAYLEKAEAELREWGAKVDVLKAKAEKSRGDSKKKYLEQVAALRKKRDALKEQLRELRGSGDEAWEDLRGGADRALDELKSSLKRAISRFKE
jgi:type I site-specific restriction endonuclease